MKLLEIRELRKTFGRTAALDGVDLQVDAGEIVALAGASGSGKTTLARCMMRLIEPDGGTVHFAGEDLTAMRAGRLRNVRPRIQMVFQDPLAAINPRATVARAIGDPLRIHAIVPRAERRQRVIELLRQVRLPPEIAERRPHEISGGQRQRVAIARAIASRPDLIVLDEPVSSLDVSVRAEILNLLLDIRDRTGVAYLLISHDLAVVRAVAGRVAIMADGRIVEEGRPDELFRSPQTEAARALVDAVPRLHID